MRDLLLGVTCFLSVSMSAQADINDYMNAQVNGTEIFMEYDHQKMLDEIDALTTQLANGSNALLSSVITPAITSGATGTDLVENTGADQLVYTITATAAWPAPTFAIGGTDFDAGSLSLDASSGDVTLTVDPVIATQSSYSFTVTATDAADNTSAATTVTFSIVGSCSSVTYNGHLYATVQIGTQCWFAENLRTEKYNTGATIATGLDNALWSVTWNGAVTVYGEGGVNEAANLGTYGRLYNSLAVDDARGLCPSGWHVPTDGEYTELTDFLGGGVPGGASIAGTPMKSSASDSPAWDGTNSNGANGSGFSGLAGGYRSISGDFNYEGDRGYFWSASDNGGDAWTRLLVGGDTEVYRYYSNPRNGFSVRCVQD